MDKSFDICPTCGTECRDLATLLEDIRACMLDRVKDYKGNRMAIEELQREYERNKGCADGNEEFISWMRLECGKLLARLEEHIRE